jgi:hypothetical protein
MNDSDRKQQQDSPVPAGLPADQPDGITAHDRRCRRCPKLGHQVEFVYCRQPGGELPCSKILDCWWETFDVEAFLRAHYTPEQIALIHRSAQDKRITLLELIEQARRRTGGQ